MLGIDEVEIALRRRNLELFAVWVHELGEYRFPRFQFYHRRPFDRMPQLLELLPDPSNSGWGRVEWFVSCRSLLNGGCPAEYLSDGRFDEVFEVAKNEAADTDRW